MTSSRSLLLASLGALAERRLAVGAICGATVIFALVALAGMPLQLLPEIRYAQIRIIGDLPGQTSSVIEESINEPMEAVLEGVPGIFRMESRSGDGRSYIDLFFEPDYDLDRALRDVTQAAQRAQSQIPAGFPEPRIFAVSTVEEPALQFAFGSDAHSVAELRRLLRSNVLPRLRAIPGVDAVYIGREDVPELVVEVDPVRQAANGVRLADLEQVLAAATDPSPSSTMRTPHFDGIAVLEAGGWAVEHLSRRPVPVAGTSSYVPLGSLATVHRAGSESNLSTRLDGRSAVLVAVHRSPQAHSLRLAREARAAVEEMETLAAMEGVVSTILYDDSVVTRSAVQSVVVAAVGGALLAMLLLLLTLGNRRYVPLVAVVVGVSLSAAVVVLHLMGMSLNLLTLAGLLLSVGLGLDYTIIYFDRLDRLRERAPAGGTEQAGEPDGLHIHAMADVAGPLLGALLTTLAAVLPFLLVKGLVALLFHPLIWTVVAAAVFSFVFAVVLLSTFSRSAVSGASEAGAGVPKSLDERWLRRPGLQWLGAGVLLAILLLGGRALPFEVLPVVDDGFVDLRITHPVGISHGEMDRLAREVERRLLGVEGTDALFSTVSGYFRDGLPAFRPGTADFMVRVATAGGDRTSASWAADARAAIAELEVPELGVSVTLPRIRGVQTRLSDADLVVVLTREDGDLLALTEVAGRVAEVLGGVDGLSDVSRVRGGVSPRWMARPRDDQFAALGVDPAAAGRTLQYVLEGRVLRQRMEAGEPLALRVRYDRRGAGGPQHLSSARVPSLSGGEVQLGDLVDFVLVEEPTHIERREGQRVVRVSAQFDPAGPGPGVVADRVSRAMRDAGLSGEVSWWLEGELEALEETTRTFTVALLLALGMVLALLAIQYGSLSFALAGAFSIPLAGAGTVILLGVLGRPLDAMVLAGLLIAVGIVANNVILVLSETRELMGGPQRVALEDALARASRNRLRPITLTVLSTVLGMSPLLLGGAEVFGLLQPLAIALTGALLISVPLACLLLPGLVLGLVRLGERFGMAREGEATEG